MHRGGRRCCGQVSAVHAALLVSSSVLVSILYGLWTGDLGGDAWAVVRTDMWSGHSTGFASCIVRPIGRVAANGLSARVTSLGVCVDHGGELSDGCRGRSRDGTSIRQSRALQTGGKSNPPTRPSVCLPPRTP